MEIIFVIIGITCSILLIGIGVLIGVGTNISKFFEASLPIVQKTNRIMDPMCDFYLRMMKDMTNEE